MCVWAQALEEAAADAAEEEQRRLQTQTELQDRYRMDLEREKLVRLCHIQQQRNVLKHFLFLCVCADFSEELVLYTDEFSLFLTTSSVAMAMQEEVT